MTFVYCFYLSLFEEKGLEGSGDHGRDAVKGDKHGI